MPQARNKDELRKLLQPAIQKACNYVIQKIWNENKEIVRVVVYESGMPEEYNRSMGFLNAWDYTQDTHNPTNKDGYAKFYYKPNNMGVGSVDYGAADFAQHIGVGGEYRGRDARYYLADIIYQENGCNGAGDLFGDGYWRKARNAWKVLNDRRGKRKMKQWMKEGLEAAGLTVQMHNKAIEVTTTKVD